MIHVETAALVGILDEAIAHLKTYEAAQPAPANVSADAQAYDTATQILAELRDLLGKSRTAHCSFAEADIAAIRLERVRQALAGVSARAPETPIELF